MFKYIVYKTTNKINGKIYIGVHGTDTDEFDGYIGCGIWCEVRAKKKYTFHEAVRKYGYNNFIRETLFEFEGTEEGKRLAYAKEAELVNRDFIKRKDVYNMCIGGKVPSSSTEKAIAQYDLNGNFIKSWYSISLAEKETRVSDSALQYACQNERVIKDYQWRYFNGDTSNIGSKEPRTKVVYQFDLQGNYVTYYKSAHEADKQTGISYKCINSVCLNKTAQAGGFYWSYKKHFNYDPTKVKKTAVACYDDEGNFIKSYTTLTEAAKDNNVGLTTLHNCISGRSKHCAKLRWRYFYGNTSNISPLPKKNK